MQYTLDHKQYAKISFITPCMGRLSHIKETLINNIERNRNYSRLEYILLDYNSPDGLEDWAKKNLQRYIDKGVLTYYKTIEPKFFHMSHAKNVGHLLATGSIVVNVDGDNFVGHGYAEHLNDMFLENPKIYCRCSRNGDNGSGGRVAIMRDQFLQLGGYEEQMLGWGYEDADLVSRARRHRVHGAFTNSVWCKAIQHDDASRERYQTPPNRISILRKNESLKTNFGLYEYNKKHRIVVANEGRTWGKASVVKNFSHPFDISSDIIMRLASPEPPVSQPIVIETRAPITKPVAIGRPNAVGYFSVSHKLRTRVEPHPSQITPRPSKR